MSKKVLVALSGGVDSAVSAYLLKQRGFDVTGVFMRNWSSLEEDEEIGDCVEKEYLDAQWCATKLDIELLIVDFVREYWNEVFDPCLKKWEKGVETPNPDILCNEKIKFHHLLNWSKKKGFSNIATGHYVRNYNNGEGLMRGIQPKDTFSPDQSYFLSRIPRNSLKHSIFPLGELSKSQVRNIAHKEQLYRVSGKKASVGLCFIGQKNIREFLSQFIDFIPGPIFNETEIIIGQHEGLGLYTRGQIIKIDGKKLYVTQKRSKDNGIVVAPHSTEKLHSGSAHVDELLWLDQRSEEKWILGEFIYCLAQCRTQQNAVPCIIISNLNQNINNYVSVKFLQNNKVWAITPGQVMVFYDEEEKLLGSAYIKDYFTS